MSEPYPEHGAPMNPEEMRRLEEMLGSPGFPDFTATAIETLAGIHAKWYFSWIAAGIPEMRAAEWAEIMIAALFRAGPA